MLNAMRDAPYDLVDQKCLKSCEAEVYEISSADGEADTFVEVK